MSTVTGIEESRGIVRVYFDDMDTLFVRKTDFDRAPVVTDEDIDTELWINRISSFQFPAAWESALSCLDRAARTGKQIQQALQKRGFLFPAIDAVIERLRETGLVDDARFAERMAEIDTAKAVGIHAFKRKLMAKGISEDDAENALEAFDDEQQEAACRNLAQSMVRKYEKYDSRERRNKLSQALARRGFSWDTISAVLDEMFE